MFLFHSSTVCAKHQELTTRKNLIYIAHSVGYHKVNNKFNTKNCAIV
jgi:hypothetical protein